MHVVVFTGLFCMDSLEMRGGGVVPALRCWFGCNRWFLWALSCEWGCSIPSYNDRGPQAPSFCPSGAKNWSVRWVHVDPLTYFHLDFICSAQLPSLLISPLSLLTLFIFLFSSFHLDSLLFFVLVFDSRSCFLPGTFRFFCVCPSADVLVAEDSCLRMKTKVSF